MNLESQVCSLELAKRLKELGVKQDSLFYWGSYENPIYGITSEYKVPDEQWFVHYIEDSLAIKVPPDYSISAFTVAELGEMLPSYRVYTMRYVNKGWRCKDRDRYSSPQQETTEANARAKMLIWLIEEGYVQCP